MGSINDAFNPRIANENYYKFILVLFYPKIF